MKNNIIESILQPTLTAPYRIGQRVTLGTIETLGAFVSFFCNFPCYYNNFIKLRDITHSYNNSLNSLNEDILNNIENSNTTIALTLSKTYGSDFNYTRSIDGSNAMILAIQHNDKMVQDYIIEHQGNTYNPLLNIQISNLEGRDALIYATITGDLETCKFVANFADKVTKEMIEKDFGGSNKNFLNQEEKVLVQNYLKQQNRNKYIIDYNLTDCLGKTALMYAAESKNPKIFEFLALKAIESNVKYGNPIDFNICDVSGKNLLHYAAMNENSHVLDVIHKFGIEINLNQKDNSKKTPLDYAKSIEEKDYSPITAYITGSDHDYTIDPTTIFGVENASDFIKKYKFIEKTKKNKFIGDNLFTLDKLLTKFSNEPNNSIAYNFVNSHLLLPVSREVAEVAKNIYQKYLDNQESCKLFIGNTFGKQALLVTDVIGTYGLLNDMFVESVKFDKIEKYALSNIVGINATTSKTRTTPLMAAAESCNKNTLNWVFENSGIGTNEIDLNKTDNRGKNALMISIENKNHYATKEIMNYRVEAVRSLIRKYPKIKSDTNAFERAAESIRNELNQLINTQDKNGTTPLMDAVNTCDIDIINIFIKECNKLGLNLEVNLKNTHGKNAFEMAIENKNYQALKAILSTNEGKSHCLEYKEKYSTMTLNDRKAKNIIESVFSRKEKENMNIGKVLVSGNFKNGINIDKI